jgi:hypothetical protein
LSVPSQQHSMAPELNLIFLPISDETYYPILFHWLTWIQWPSRMNFLRSMNFMILNMMWKTSLWFLKKLYIMLKHYRDYLYDISSHHVDTYLLYDVYWEQPVNGRKAFDSNLYLVVLQDEPDVNWITLLRTYSRMNRCRESNLHKTQELHVWCLKRCCW